MKILKFLFTFLVCACLAVNTMGQNRASIIKRDLWRKANSSDRNIKISVGWESLTSDNAKYRKLVQKAITETWQRYSCLEFVGWDRAEVNGKRCDICIRVNDEWPYTTALGTDIRGQKDGMVLNFTFKNYGKEKVSASNIEYYIYAIAVHEFGHAIGLAHEHSNPNCHFQNCNEKPYPGEEIGDWVVNACDLNSVMNYCNPHFANDGVLSDLDKDAMVKLYPPHKNKAPDISGISLVYNTEQIAKAIKSARNITHKCKVYVSGSPDELAEIDHVYYYLDPNWFTRRQSTTAKNPASNFGLNLSLSGNVHVVAFVYFKKKDDDEAFRDLMLPLTIRLE